MKKTLLGLCVGSVLLLGVVSCGPKAGQDIKAVIGEAQRLAGAGDIDKALATLTPYYSSRHYTREQANILAAMIQIEVNAGRVDAALVRFGNAAAKAPEQALPVLDYMEVNLIRGRQWALAQRVFDVAKSKLADSPASRTALANVKIDLLMARDGYKVALAELKTILSGLPDEGAARNVRVVGNAVFAAGDWAAGDALYSSALDCPVGNVMTRDAAAEGWMKIAARSGLARDIIARLEELNRRKVQPEVLVRLINGSYPVLLGNTSDHGTYQALYTLCQDFEKRMVSDYDKILLRGMMLDVSYFLENFEESLRLIEQGAGGIPADQKPQMIAKVRAHMAMKNNQPREAVKYFREFMVIIEKQGHDEIDPVSNCRVTREMVLGLNAKRIGDLLISAGDPDEAKKAYDEARGHYKKAILEFPDPASKENAKISRELAGIPSK